MQCNCFRLSPWLEEHHSILLPSLPISSFVRARAIEGIIPNKVALSNPAPRGIAGHEDDRPLDVEGQNKTRVLAAKRADNAKDRSIPAPYSPQSGRGGSDLSNAFGSQWGRCRVGHDGSHLLESTRAPGAIGAYTPSSLTPNRCNHEAALDEGAGATGSNGGVGGENDDDSVLAEPHETLLTMSVGLDGEEVEGMEDDVTAADWLDVTTALLDAVNEADEARRELVCS